MGFLIILLLIFVFSMAIPKPSVDNGDKLVVQKKTCPPHQWFWQEIVDQNGNKVGERIVCKVCGPLKPIGGE